MRRSLDETLRRGLVLSRYRLLLDASDGLSHLPEELTVYSGPKQSETWPELLTAMCVVSAKPSAKAARELRRRLAAAGAPVMCLGAKGHRETARSSRPF